MKYRLRVFPAAEADVDSAAQFIARDNLAAALRFYDCVDSTYGRIREYPARWPRYGLDDARLAHLRKRSVLKFPNYLFLFDDSCRHAFRKRHGKEESAERATHLYRGNVYPFPPTQPAPEHGFPAGRMPIGRPAFPSPRSSRPQPWPCRVPFCHRAFRYMSPKRESVARVAAGNSIHKSRDPNLADFLKNVNLCKLM